MKFIAIALFFLLSACGGGGDKGQADDKSAPAFQTAPPVKVVVPPK